MKSSMIKNTKIDLIMIPSRGPECNNSCLSLLCLSKCWGTIETPHDKDMQSFISNSQRRIPAEYLQHGALKLIKSGPLSSVPQCPPVSRLAPEQWRSRWVTLWSCPVWWEGSQSPPSPGQRMVGGTQYHLMAAWHWEMWVCLTREPTPARPPTLQAETRLKSGF